MKQSRLVIALLGMTVIVLFVLRYNSFNKCKCCSFKDALERYVAGDLSSAATEYRKILEKSPEDSAAHFCYAQVLHSQGNFQEAKKYYTSALETIEHAGGRDCDFQASLGKVHLDVREYAEAITFYKQADALRPNTPAILRGVFRRGGEDHFGETRNVDRPNLLREISQFSLS